MANPLRRSLRRVANRLAEPYAAPLAEELREVRRQLDAADKRFSEVVDDLFSVLRHAYERDAVQRQRLHQLRQSDEYELAFTEEEPLVSFIVPTYTRYESLRDVSLPSILGQTYSNIEVIVAGDGSPPETERTIAEIGDPRIRFHNRTVRGPYPDDERRRWYMVGTPPFNDGLALARGRWIASLGDDDALRPSHTETLLEAARAGRLEHSYGRLTVRYRSGESYDIGTFPPQLGHFGLQAGIYHSGLRFFEMEPADHLYEEPNDWSLCRRMLAAGVRFGMVDEVVVDKHETRHDTYADRDEDGIPIVE
jgi:hypothetical protein